MTDLIYQSDSYVRTFTAKITAVDEANCAVLLDQTAFYPGGGGQPALHFAALLGNLRPLLCILRPGVFLGRYLSLAQ